MNVIKRKISFDGIDCERQKMTCEVKREDLLSLFPLLCSMCDRLTTFDIVNAASVFRWLLRQYIANFSCGIAVLGTPKVPLHQLIGDK